MLNPLDRENLKKAFSAAHPFPFVKFENFLDPDAAKEIAAAYPAFDVALAEGRTFQSVNEKKKVQITDAAKFPSPVARLNDALASSQFLSDLSYITGMRGLLADPELVGEACISRAPAGGSMCM
jgi:hypothetical protein